MKSEPEDSISCKSEPLELNAEPIAVEDVPINLNSFTSASSSSKILNVQQPTKRKLNVVHEEILQEIKRANRIADENQKETIRLLQQTNDIAERNLSMYRDFFDFLKTKFK